MRSKERSSSCVQIVITIGVALVSLGLLLASWLDIEVPSWITDIFEEPAISEPALPQPTVVTPTRQSSPSAPTVVAAPTGIPEGAVAATLIRTIDGDTAEVLVNGQLETVRYVGIDTPERGEPGYKAAEQANRRLLGSGDLFLVRDRSDRDRYGRLLRFIYTAEGVFVNREMVAQGYAQPIEYRPDVTLAADFREAGRQAAEARLGFWSGNGEPDGAMPYALTLEEVSLSSQPGSRETTIVRVPQGTPLTVYARDQAGRWLQVRTPDRAGGWLQANKVFLNVAMANIGVENGGVVEAPAIAATQPPATAAAPASSTGNIAGIVLYVVENQGSNEVLELQNSGRRNVDISGWMISGSIGDQVCTIPDDTTLRAGERYQVVSGRSEVSDRGFKCTGANLWSNDGETIFLRSPDGEEIQVGG